MEPNGEPVRLTSMAFTENEIRDWLTAYAWMGTDDDKKRTVDCIMAQDDWKYIDGVTERYASMAEDPGPQASMDAHGFALSALYECHDGPHADSCPERREAD